ncbi:MAG: hypothetical protein Q4G45_06925 [Actinomycetia bacterium]|nr:hypothetical protein [Actinomycetes bacterium]
MSRRGVLVGAGAGISALTQTLLANATPRIVTDLDAQSWYDLSSALALRCLPATITVAALAGFLLSRKATS